MMMTMFRDSDGDNDVIMVATIKCTSIIDCNSGCCYGDAAHSALLCKAAVMMSKVTW